VSEVPEPLLALVGPTASGKTAASIAIAEALSAEIICVDSMLVYRGMEVGTAKPSAVQRARVRHHMIDLVDPDEPFSVARFQSLARRAIGDIGARGDRPLLVGGGGLYYRAVVDGLEFPGTEPGVRRLLTAEASVIGPEALHARLASFDRPAAGKIAPANVRRTVRALEVAAITGVPFSSYAEAWERYPSGAVRAAGIELTRPVLHRRIERRVIAMLPGLLNECRQLLDRGFGGFLTSTQAIGYAEAVDCLEGRLGQDEVSARIIRRTKALARRQLAWFRRDPRIRWFAAGEEGAAGIQDELVQYLRADVFQIPASVKVRAEV
jgi:tRNA dimethylallyltransferase